MEEITFTRDYRMLFKQAVESRNTDRMVEIFDLLANECGLPDTERDKSQAEHGKSAAQRKNEQDAATLPGKKI